MTNFFNPESECFSKAGAQEERFYEIGILLLNIGLIILVFFSADLIRTYCHLQKFEENI